MSSFRMPGLVARVVLVVLAGRGVASAADAGGAKDPLKEAGLVRSGAAYVLPDEAAVVDGMKALRTTKAAADKETRARQVIENQIAAKKKTEKDSEKEYHSLETRLTLVKDVTVHNNIVNRLNRLVANHKEALASEKDLEEQAGKVSTANKTKFVDDLTALNEKAGAVSAKYQALAADPAVKAALAKVAAQKVALGPSADFAAAAADLKKWQGEVESEAIPMRDEHGVHLVDVLLDGEHFLMGVDTGASDISLTGEVAEKLKMAPTDQDPTVRIRLANGSVIEGKEMKVKSVRVGRFTLEDVPCIVLQKGLPDAPLLLGGSFLNHFVVKMDNAANELRLTEIAEPGQSKAAGPATRGTPAAGAGGR